MPATYLPGTGTLLGRGARWVLVDHPLDPAVVGPLWTAMTAGSSVADLVVVADRLRPGVAVVAVDVALHEHAGQGPVVHEARDGSVRLALSDGDGAGWVPLAGGVVGAAALALPAGFAGEPVAPPTLAGAAPVLAERVAADRVGAGVREHTAERTPLPPPLADRLGSTVPMSAADLLEAGLARGGAATEHRPAGAGPLVPESDPLVWALRCPDGHPSPPELPTCRQCGAPVPEAEPLRLPRPPLGRLVLPDGRWVLLDRGAVLGRQPTGLADAGAWPHLVQLPGDRTQLSRQHVGVELEGWSVLARDLDSLGGTLLETPGRPPQRMRPGQAYALEPGQVLNLADGYRVRFVVELSGDPS